MINAFSARATSFRSLSAAVPVPPKPQPDPEPLQVGSRPAFGPSKLKQRMIDEDPIELRTGGKLAAQLIPPEDEMGRYGIAGQVMEPPPEEEMGRKLNLGSEVASSPEDEVIANKAAWSPEDELIHGGRIAEVPPEEEMVRNLAGDLRPADFQPIFDEDDRRPLNTAAASQVLSALQLANTVRQFSIR